MKTCALSISLFSLILSITSCEPSEKQIKLSKEAQQFLVYEQNESFKLRNEQTSEVKTFSVTSLTIDYKDTQELDNISLGLEKDLFENRTISFSDDNNCEGSISLRAKKENQFEFSIFFYNCLEGQIFTNPKYIGDVNIRSHLYHDTYMLKSFTSKLFYSLQKGILKIEDLAKGETLFSIVTK